MGKEGCKAKSENGDLLNVEFLTENRSDIIKKTRKKKERNAWTLLKGLLSVQLSYGIIITEIQE